MRDVGRVTGLSSDDLDAIRLARSVAWVEFETAHPDEANTIDVAFVRDLADDPVRCLEFVASIQALRTGDQCPAAVLATAGELRCHRKAKVREWREKHG